MPDTRKEELRNMLDAMVDDNQEQAQVHFHNYLEDRMKGIINPMAAAADEEAAPAVDNVEDEGEPAPVADEVVDGDSNEE